MKLKVTKNIHTGFIRIISQHYLKESPPFELPTEEKSSRGGRGESAFDEFPDILDIADHNQDVVGLIGKIADILVFPGL
jgi:hypothetical protein